MDLDRVSKIATTSNGTQHQQQHKDAISSSLIDESVSFESMCLDMRILKSLKKLGYAHPTLIQSSAIPLALQGKDILARARTGSGKTAAYTIPIVQKILIMKQQQVQQSTQQQQKQIQQQQKQSKSAVHQPITAESKGVRAIVLVPTRELCEQVKKNFLEICFYCTHLINIVQLGGSASNDATSEMEEQRGLLRDIPDIIISTPTRLVNHLKANNIKLDQSLEMLVVDEADLVLSYGYQDDLNTIKSYLPKVCQGFLMSATLTQQVDELKKLILHTPAILKLEEEKEEKTNLTEYSIKCLDFDRYLLVFSLLRLKLMQGKIIFFVNDTTSCYRLKLFLERFHIRAAVLNSELPINSRHHIILQFNAGTYDYLIATDESFKTTNNELVDDDEEENQDIIEDGENSIDQDEQEEEDDEEEEDPLNGGDDEFFTKESDDDEDDDEEDDDQEKDNEESNEEGDEEDNDKVNEDLFFSKDDGEEDEEPKKSNKKNNQGSKLSDKEYGVARGIDFKNVDIVINFDYPRTVKNYIHRIGRTARGSSKGIALSFITQSNEELSQKVHKVRGESGYNVKPFEFKMSAIEGFRYRVEDVYKGVTMNEIKKARKNELENEIINSEKLKEHFMENPKDLDMLKHDVPLLKNKVQSHLGFIPEYLVPESMKTSINNRHNRLPVIASNKTRNSQYHKQQLEKRQQQQQQKASKKDLKRKHKEIRSTGTSEQKQELKASNQLKSFKLSNKDLDSLLDSGSKKKSKK